MPSAARSTTPKIPSWMDEFGYCRVEWGPYRPMGVREAYSWKIAKEIVPTALGGDGKTERWINHFGYNQDRYHPLNIMQSKLSHLDKLAFGTAFPDGTSEIPETRSSHLCSYVQIL